jgi:hypothetical protein
MTSSAKGSFGYQGTADVGVSILTDFDMTYAQSCIYNPGSTRAVTCDAFPVNAENYFNTTDYPLVYSALGDYEGIRSQGSVIDTAVCLQAKSIPYLCTTGNNNHTYVVEMIKGDDWNFGSNIGAGTVALGWGA